jgi:hypothetical protein
MSENKFKDTILESGDIMVILSSGEAVELHNPKVGSGAILVVAQMPLELLQQFATKVGVSFTPSEYGVYKKVFHPSERKLFIPISIATCPNNKFRSIHDYSKRTLVPLWCAQYSWSYRWTST